MSRLSTYEGNLRQNCPQIVWNCWGKIHKWCAFCGSSEHLTKLWLKFMEKLSYFIYVSCYALHVIMNMYTVCIHETYRTIYIVLRQRCMKLEWTHWWIASKEQISGIDYILLLFYIMCNRNITSKWWSTWRVDPFSVWLWYSLDKQTIILIKLIQIVKIFYINTIQHV